MTFFKVIADIFPAGQETPAPVRLTTYGETAKEAIGKINVSAGGAFYRIASVTQHEEA